MLKDKDQCIRMGIIKLNNTKLVEPDRVLSHKYQNYSFFLMLKTFIMGTFTSYDLYHRCRILSKCCICSVLI